MSGTGSTSVAVGVGGGGELGYGGYRPPFTQVQWQELEHQAMIYKYLVAGLPVPSDLVIPIRRNFEALSARFFNHPSLGYCSYYGKKFDPEPGRCRRTDGKKWRCSKDAHPDSKYCERHMHRGRNRSRKPVESQSATSQPISTAMSLISTGCSSKSGSFQGNGNGSFQNIPMYSVGSSEGSSFGNNVMQMEPIIYGVNNNKEFSFSPDASGSVGNLGLGTSAGSASWRLMPSQVSSQNIPNAFEPIDSTTISKQRQQHCFFGNEIGLKQEQQQSVHPFFSEWPSTKESWSNLDDDNGSNTNVFSSTQLSISTPRVSDFSPRSAYSPNEA